MYLHTLVCSENCSISNTDILLATVIRHLKSLCGNRLLDFLNLDTINNLLLDKLLASA
jgi:hypothetical protein